MTPPELDHVRGVAGAVLITENALDDVGPVPGIAKMCGAAAQSIMRTACDFVLFASL